ncbi:MAG: helix-turn-helix transcriptional regulator [Luteimonas sp.]|nr:helix-turn-helix transcriptional regulator [Luteimonas sp.]
MMDTEGLLEAIGSLYGTMLEDGAEARWMDVVRDCVGAEHAVLSEATPAALSMHCSEIDDGMRPLARRLAFTTMYDPALASMPAKAAIRMSDHMPLRDLLRTELFHELVRPLHGGHALAFTWPAAGGGRSAIAVCRDIDRARDFGDDELAAMQPVLLHVQNALRIRARLRALEASLAHAHAALDAMPEAAIIVDGARRVRYLNPAARRLALEGDVRVERGALRASRARDDRALQALLDRALGLARGMRMPRDRGDAAVDDGRMQIAIARVPPLRPLLVAAMPAAGVASCVGHALAADAAVLLLRDPDRLPEGSVESLALAFDLTPREAELALALAQGAPLAQVACQLGIGAGTARQYLKRVFAKTGVARQSALVGLLRNLG